MSSNRNWQACRCAVLGIRTVLLLVAGAILVLPRAHAASPRGQIPPTTISVTVDRGPQSSYFVGDSITICVNADTRVGPGVADYSPLVRITDVLPNGSSSVVFEGQVAGQRCTQAVVTPPLGAETIRADYLVIGITGQPQIVNTARVSFQVRDRPLATPPPPPPPLTATPLPTATPSPEPTLPASEPVASAPSPFSLVHMAACDESGSVTVELGWPEAIRVQVYSIYRDGEFIGSEGPGTLWFIDPLAPNSATVLYEVVASDVVGAQVAEPNLLLVETPNCPFADGDGLN